MELRHLLAASKDMINKFPLLDILLWGGCLTVYIYIILFMFFRKKMRDGWWETAG
jgi:hypothetical protein